MTWLSCIQQPAANISAQQSFYIPAPAAQGHGYVQTWPEVLYKQDSKYLPNECWPLFLPANSHTPPNASKIKIFLDKFCPIIGTTNCLDNDSIAATEDEIDDQY